ncbi:hypothetical protein DTW91_01475 [Chryseobacterium sp. SC28]|nr:hypothetical protein DTW91_01475 [Chryseobacterium sp. SC28]
MCCFFFLEFFFLEFFLCYFGDRGKAVFFSLDGNGIYFCQHACRCGAWTEGIYRRGVISDWRSRLQIFGMV